MRKNILWTISLVTFGVGCYAQSGPSQTSSSKYTSTTLGRGLSLKDLYIGDQVPEIEIRNVLNYGKSTVNLSDFSGKLIILDFWATWCSPCVAAFPKLDSLQSKFNGKIQIISVTSEEPEKVSAFLSRLKEIKHLTPMVAAGDKLLKTFFKHNYLPHYVWIGKDRNVIAITNGNEINEKNINKALVEQQFILPEKKDTVNVIRPKGQQLLTTPVYHIKDDSLIKTSTISDEHLGRYSLLCGYISGYGARAHEDPTHIGIYNVEIAALYNIALNQTMLINPHMIKVEISDSAFFENLTGKSKKTGLSLGAKGLAVIEWKRQNAYIYELKVPPGLADKKFSIMADELNSYFGALYNIEGVLEERNMKFLALTRLSSIDKLATKKTDSKGKIDKDKFHLALTSSSLEVLRVIISNETAMMVVNETGYEGKIDLELNCELANLEQVNKELERYDLKFVEREKKVKMAVIRMKNATK